MKALMFNAQVSMVNECSSIQCANALSNEDCSLRIATQIGVALC